MDGDIVTDLRWIWVQIVPRDKTASPAQTVGMVIAAGRTIMNKEPDAGMTFAPLTVATRKLYGLKPQADRYSGNSG